MQNTEQQKKVWDTLWSSEVSYSWDSLSQIIYDEIVRVAGAPGGLQLVETGSGTGKISLRLAEEGARVTLVDYSEKALENSRAAFRQSRQEGTFVLSDIRSLMLSDNTFDLTWNAGVLEHFDYDEKVTILQECSRVTKPGGSILIFTPYAACLPYRVGKAFSENRGTWMYGVEEPVMSLHDEFAASDIEWVSEYNIGFKESLPFLDFISGTGQLKEWISEWYDTLDKQDQALFPGYLLVSVGKVKAQNKD